MKIELNAAVSVVGETVEDMLAEITTLGPEFCNE